MHHGLCWSSRVCAALGLLVGLWVVSGCDTNGASSRTATVGDLENQTFTFSNGQAFATALANTTVTLSFGDFTNDGDGNPNTGPFTLQTPGGTGTGTVTIASCNLTFNDVLNTFDAITFPELQPGQTVPLNPCEVDTNTASLTVQNATTGVTSTSAVPNTIPTNDVAFVLTEGGGTGSYSVVDLDTLDTFNDVTFGGVHSDAVARFFNGLIYVVNRLGADNIQVIDPQQGYTTPLGLQLSVGNGADPHDIAFVSPEKAYVSRFGATELFIINPTTLTEIGEIDLSDRVKLGDPDGLPEMDRMLVHNGKVYLTLEHLDRTNFFTPFAPGEVVVIDAATDTVEQVIPLSARNPFSSLQFSPELNRILVSTVGNFGDADGGIEAIDPVTQTVDPGFIIDEATIGGDITHFEVVSATKGFAIILDSSFQGLLVSFNPSTGQRLNTLLGPVDFFIPHFAINTQNELYLAVNKETAPIGVRIFDTTLDVELTAEPLNVGALPPNFILFIEQ